MRTYMGIDTEGGDVHNIFNLINSFLSKILRKHSQRQDYDKKKVKYTVRLEDYSSLVRVPRGTWHQMKERERERVKGQWFEFENEKLSLQRRDKQIVVNP